MMSRHCMVAENEWFCLAGGDADARPAGGREGAGLDSQRNSKISKNFKTVFSLELHCTVA